MPRKKVNKELLEQKGIPFVIMDGEVFDIKESETEIDVDTLHQMQKDETISAALSFLENMVSSIFGDYSNEDKGIDEFVHFALENCEKSITNFLKLALREAMIYGWCAAEILWDLKDGKVVLKDLLLYDSRGMTIEVEKGNIIAVNQYSAKGKIKIPAEKMFIFRLGNGIYGESMLRRVYRLWKIKSEFIKSWAIALEKFAIPIVWGKTRKAEVTTEDGKKKSSVEVLHEKLKDFHRRTTIATDNDTEIQYLTTGVGGVHFSKIYIDAIEYLNKLIFRNFLLPNLLLGSEQTGAYSLGNVHYKLFKNASKSIAQQIASAFLDQVISRLISYNFGSVKDYGEFALVDELTSEEREQLSKMLVNLVNAGFVDPIEEKQLADNMLKLPR